MSRTKRRIGIVLLLLFVLIGIPVWITYREFRQARLDQALIAAIKAGDDKQILAALAEGANGEAQETSKSPTFQMALRHLLDHLRHPVASPSQHRFDNEHLPALLLLYQVPWKWDVQHGRSFRSSPKLPDLAVVRALLDQGAQQNDKDAWGRTPLWYASLFDDGDAVRLLLARGADKEATDLRGNTPLIVAPLEAAKVLLEQGANIEARNDLQQTPLILAARSNEVDLVRLLLEHRAQVSATDKFGNTAFDVVRDDRDPDTRKIAALLRRYGAK